MVQRKTNKGKIIDIEAMIEANKSSRSVGNMPVNAGGEIVGPSGQIISSNEERVRQYYETNESVSSEQVSIKGEPPKTAGSFDSKGRLCLC